MYVAFESVRERKNIIAPYLTPHFLLLLIIKSTPVLKTLKDILATLYSRSLNDQ
jgi:hypothetical protein